MTPTLWGRASSVNVQKVMWCLAECGVTYDRIDAGGRYGRTDEDDFAAMAPLRRVPVWQDGQITVWESHAILRHLGRGPASVLWPDDLSARAVADQWMDFTNTTLMQPFVGVFFQVVRFPPEERSVSVLEKHLKSLHAALDVMEGQLTSSMWLGGEAFTLADIAAGAPMFRYHDIGIERPERPALQAWYQRLTQREAFRANVMTSYDELRPS